MRCSVVLEFGDGDSNTLSRLTQLHRDAAKAEPGNFGPSCTELCTASSKFELRS